jgi:hypothetical protein
MSVTIGFGLEPQVISFDRILPSRQLSNMLRKQTKFKQIRASLEAVGLIEPLTVTRADRSGRHTLLDGHVRLMILRELGHQTAPCLIAKDDEAYTYNNRINRLSTVQEHHMIRRALDRGVQAQRLADALNLDVSTIHRRATLLEGICPEAVPLLADRQFSVDVTRLLRKVKPLRQVECIELMIAANSMTLSYMQALLLATPPEWLVDKATRPKIKAATAETMARLQKEMDQVSDRYKLIEQSYGEDVLNLVLAKGYLQKLLENPHITEFLSKHQPDILREFNTIVETVSLEG